jgi:hypothetical protein
VIAYHLIERGTEYVDLGATYFDQRKKDTVQQQLVKRLEKLGSVAKNRDRNQGGTKGLTRGQEFTRLLQTGRR